MFYLNYQKNVNPADLMHYLKSLTILDVNVTNISCYLVSQSARDAI